MEHTTSISSHSWRAYGIAACFFLIMFFIVGITVSCAGLFYKPVSDDLGFSPERLGIYISFYYLSSMLTLLVAGQVIERYSARLILTLCAALAGGTLVAMGQFDFLWQFYAAGVLLGVGQAFLLYIGLPTMLNRWFTARIGLFMGICSAGSGLGGVAFNPLSGHLISEYGWRTAYMVLGAIILVVIVPLLAIVLRDRPMEQQKMSTQDTAREASGVSYEVAVRKPAFYLLVIFAFVINAVAMLNLFIPTYLQQGHFDVVVASYVASVIMVGVTVGKIILGYMNDYHPLLGTLALVVLGAASFMLIISGQYWLIVLGGFCFGWAYAGVFVQTPLLVRKVFGTRDYPAIYSKVSMAIAIGGAISAWGWGNLASSFGYEVVFLIGAVALLLNGLLAAIALRQAKA